MENYTKDIFCKIIFTSKILDIGPCIGDNEKKRTKIHHNYKKLVNSKSLFIFHPVYVYILQYVNSILYSMLTAFMGIEKAMRCFF